MPNHVTNELVIEGPEDQIQLLFDKVTGLNVEGNFSQFSLHRIVHQPEEFNDTRAEPTAIWLIDEEIYLQCRKLSPITFGEHYSSELQALERIANYMFPEENIKFSGREEAFLWMSYYYPSIIEIGRKHVDIVKKHTFSYWRDWRMYHWGTKWETYSIISDARILDDKLLPTNTLTYLFETAWTAPDQAIIVLAKMFPKLKIRHTYIEDSFEFWGVSEYEQGSLKRVRDMVDSDFRSIATDLWGDGWEACVANLEDVLHSV